jgi:hypothetical protein
LYKYEEGVVIPVVGGCGILGNVAAVYILRYEGGAVIPVVGGCGILGNMAAVYILRYDMPSHIFWEYAKMSARLTSIVSCLHFLTVYLRSQSCVCLSTEFLKHF